VCYWFCEGVLVFSFFIDISTIMIYNDIK